MAGQQVGRHRQQLLFHCIGIGNHAPEEHIRSPRHRRQGHPQPTAGAGFGHRQGFPPLAQAINHD
jgi:hypothetical protein